MSNRFYALSQDLFNKDCIHFDELFPDDFMKRLTDFLSIDEMLKKSDFHITNQTDFEKIPEERWDSFIKQHTSFTSWREMQEDAFVEWTAKHLGLVSARR